jgi:hypothetical protein
VTIDRVLMATDPFAARSGAQELVGSAKFRFNVGAKITN